MRFFLTLNEIAFLTKVSWGSLVVVLFLVLQLYMRPYIQIRMDFVEGLCDVSVFLYVFAGMMFTKLDLSGDQAVCENACAIYRACGQVMAGCIDGMGD